MKTIVPLQDVGTVSITGSNMAEASIDIDIQGDKISELTLKCSSKLTNNLKNHHNIDNEDEDCMVEDLQSSIESSHSECNSVGSLSKMTNGVFYDKNKEQVDVLEESAINGKNDCESVLDINNTGTQFQSESLLIDINSSSKDSNNSSTDQSPTLIISNQDSSFSDIMPDSNKVESDRTVTDVGACPVSAGLSEEKQSVSGIASSIAESSKEEQSISGIEPTISESSKEEQSIFGIEPTIAESSKEEQGVSGIEPTISESSKEEQSVSGIEPTIAESSKEEQSVSGIEPTITELSEETQGASGIKSTIAESFEEEQSVSGINSTTVELSEKKQITDESATSADISKNSAGNDSREYSEKFTSEHDSDVVPISIDDSSQSFLVQGHDMDIMDCTTTSDNEDMQDKDLQLTANIEDCFTISEAEMDCSVTESEAGTAAKPDEISDKMPRPSLSEPDVIYMDESADLDISSKDMNSDTDTCNIRISESMSITEDHSASDAIVCLDDANIEHANRQSNENSVNCNDIIEPDFDKDCMLLNNSEPIEHMDCLQSSEREICDEFADKNISGNISEVLSEIADKNISRNISKVLSEIAEKNISGNISEVLSEIAENTPQTKSTLSGDQSKCEIDTIVAVFPKHDDKCASNQSCEVTDLNSYNCAPGETAKIQPDESNSCAHISIPAVKSTEDNKVDVGYNKVNETITSHCEVMEVNDELSNIEHSKTLVNDHSKEYKRQYSGSSEKSKSLIEKIGSGNEKENANKTLELKDLCSEIEAETFDEVVVEQLKDEQKISSDQDVTDQTKDFDADDEVLLVNETGEIEQVKKYSFKNILQMPNSECRNKDMLNSEKDRIVVDEKECLNFTKSCLRKKSPTLEKTTEEKIKDEQSEDIAVHQLLVDDDDEIVKKSDPAVGCGRKRTLQELKETSSASKRFRLDLAIAKLQAQSKEKSKDTVSAKILDSNDDVILTEEAPVVKSAVDETTISKDDTLVVLTSEALQSLITLRVRAFIKIQKQTNLDRLTLRTKGMQSASNLWRETAKHLEKSVVELAAVNQKLDKNKTNSSVIKQLESRSIGIQVGEDKQISQNKVVNGPSYKRPENVISSAGQLLPPFVPLSPSLHTQQPVRQQQILPRPSNSPVMRSPSLITQPPVPRTQNRPGRPPLSGTLNTPSTTPLRFASSPQSRMLQPPTVRPPMTPHSLHNVDNLIDLTDDEDYSRRTITKATKSPLSLQGIPIVPKSGIGGKTPGNGSIQPGSIAQGTGILVGQNGQILQPASQSQHFTGNPGIGGSANSSFQLVTISNTPAQAPGSFFALVPGSRPSVPAVTSVSAGKSNMSNNKRGLPQNSAQNVSSSAKTTSHSLPPSFHISNKHPAPLPSGMDVGNAPLTAKNRPPKPGLKISRVSQGIVLSWNMPSLNNVESISSYQLFAYQESESAMPRSSLWKKVGDVKALPLPMACTLTQFQEGNKYHFAVRAVDQYGRWGLYSDPSSIFLSSKT